MLFLLGPLNFALILFTYQRILSPGKRSLIWSVLDTGDVFFDCPNIRYNFVTYNQFALLGKNIFQ